MKFFKNNKYMHTHMFFKNNKLHSNNKLSIVLVRPHGGQSVKCCRAARVLAWRGEQGGRGPLRGVRLGGDRPTDPRGECGPLRGVRPREDRPTDPRGGGKSFHNSLLSGDRRPTYTTRYLGISIAVYCII